MQANQPALNTQEDLQVIQIDVNEVQEKEPRSMPIATESGFLEVQHETPSGQLQQEQKQVVFQQQEEQTTDAQRQQKQVDIRQNSLMGAAYQSIKPQEGASKCGFIFKMALLVIFFVGSTVGGIILSIFSYKRADKLQDFIEANGGKDKNDAIDALEIYYIFAIYSLVHLCLAIVLQFLPMIFQKVLYMKYYKCTVNIIALSACVAFLGWWIQSIMWTVNDFNLNEDGHDTVKDFDTITEVITYYYTAFYAILVLGGIVFCCMAKRSL